MVVFFTIFILAVVLIIQYFVAAEFYDVANKKGYESRKYFWIPFLLGITGYLLVIALPDRKTVNNNVESKESQPIFVDKDKSQPITFRRPAREVGENEWKCPQCGNVHANYVGTCGCGQRKPR